MLMIRYRCCRDDVSSTCAASISLKGLSVEACKDRYNTQRRVHDPPRSNCSSFSPEFDQILGGEKTVLSGAVE